MNFALERFLNIKRKVIPQVLALRGLGGAGGGGGGGGGRGHIT